MEFYKTETDRINNEKMKQEMKDLQKKLIMEQHQVHQASIEAQRQAVRDEIGKMADIIIHTRPKTGQQTFSSLSKFEKLVKTTMSPQQRAATLALIKQKRPLLGKILQETIPSLLSVASESDSLTGESVQPTFTSKRAGAWHQRFMDNFRIRKLQGRALSLRRPAAPEKRPKFNK